LPAQSINRKAFADNAKIDFYSCNAAAPNTSGTSISSYVSTLVPQASVSGSNGLTSYDFIYQGTSIGNRISNYVNRKLGQGPSVQEAAQLPIPTTQDHGNGAAQLNTYKNGVKL
jgi:hypothetical protein